MMDILSRLRFLPVTIFAASLMLTVRLGDIWQGVDVMRHGPLQVAGAEAQQPTGAETIAQPAQPAPERATPPSAATGSPNMPDAGSPGMADPVARSLTTQDPTLLTQSEIDLLQQLAERRESLDARQRELDMRAGMLDAAESRIGEKIAELKRFQETIESLIKTYDEQQDAKLNSLVKIYENMKPKDAALIFQELDMDTLLTVAERMKERKLADIMSKMDRQKASAVTEELMRLREIPRLNLGNG